MNYYFPFGKQLKKVQQKDRTPKKVFVLGVYASAVHAKWTDINGKQLVSAFAVASEPDIFWTGDNAEQIVSSINLPEQLGKLTVPTNKNLNGPSGRALDKLFLKPLNLDRKSTWLCDLLPESRVNEKQRVAIDKHYSADLIEKYNLPLPTVPNFDKAELNSELRRKEILEELEESQADTLILLGDLPIYWFLRFYNKEYSKLSQFGDTNETYGGVHATQINNKTYKVIPLCHPRQADRLGSSNEKWGQLHYNWTKKTNASR
jgi:uracil-DNA glycosylase